MPNTEPADIVAAMRVWTDTTDARAKRRTRQSQRDKPTSRKRKTPRIEHLLVVDTETTIDERQALTFGCARHCVMTPTGRIVTIAETLFYADDLPDTDPAGYAELREYVATNRKINVDVTYVGDREPDPYLSLMSRSEFLDKWLYPLAYRQHATVAGFNLPFDLSRLADHAGRSRDGGFSLRLWSTADGKDAPYRPRITVKTLDSRKAFIQFGTVEAMRDERKSYRGSFLDLRTLVFALTNTPTTLAGACQLFEVEHGKTVAAEHGKINRDYIKYNRRDVQATTELAEKALAEHARHPVDLAATKAYSPASIAKAYLRELGVTPILDRQPDFPPEILGAAMASFYGGRSECRIRRTPVPVAICDFTSMYPTVDILLGLWDILTRQKVRVDDATAQTRALVDSLDLDGCFDPTVWRQFVGLCQVIPEGDILPLRGKYLTGDSYRIGVNPVHSTEPMWYTIPDIIASKLLTGKTPRIVRAVRFVPEGKQLPGLRTVRLRGDVPVNPRTDDLFKATIEERQHIGKDTQTGKFLKVMANAGSYGILVQMNRKDGETADATVYSNPDQPWRHSIEDPEEPGEYAFPPVATCITGAARLMLAMLERCVTDAGGKWVFCDTDSMAIVANETGESVACPGGGETTPDGTEAVRVLSMETVEGIRERFAALNPYRESAVRGTILKLEHVTWCYAVSAKRYATYEPHPETGFPVIDPEKHEPSEIVLGSYLNPTNPDSLNRDWIRQAWAYVIARELGYPVEEPEWIDRPALTRLAVSSPHVLAPFARWNGNRPWRETVKPHNFLVGAKELPADTTTIGRLPMRLVAPYNADATQWEDMAWWNMHDPTGEPFTLLYAGITAATYRDVLEKHAYKAEVPFNGPDGSQCLRRTTGALSRRPVQVGRTRYIGKEANNAEERQDGLMSEDESLAEYGGQDDFRDLVLPVLRQHTATEIAERVNTRGEEALSDNGKKRAATALERRSGLIVLERTIAPPETTVTVTAQAIRRILNGSKPRPHLRAALTRAAGEFIDADLTQWLGPGDYRYVTDATPVLMRHARERAARTGKPCRCGCGQPASGRSGWAGDAHRKRATRRAGRDRSEP